MIFYSEKNVYEAAKERISFLFDEFYPEHRFVVGFSGGKDSTVTLQLVHEVMVEKGITDKLPVMWLDQEVEAPMVVDYAREVMNLPWVEPYWLQIPFREWNASKGDWFNVWGEGEKWCREKEPDSIHDLDLPVKEMFNNVMTSAYETLFGEGFIALGGVRIDESPMRRLGLTRGEVYKGITWGKLERKGMIFYPIWDWGVNDVWYYIFSNGHSYCKLYNYWFTKKHLKDCRVSSFIHENAIQSLKEIKEVNPEFFERALRRVENINSTTQSYEMLLQYVNGLPPYFESWDEYVEYLAYHLIDNPKNAEKMVRTYRSACNLWVKKGYGDWKEGMENTRATLGIYAVHAILAEDFDMTKMAQQQYRTLKYFKEHEREIEAARAASIQ